MSNQKAPLTEKSSTQTSFKEKLGNLYNSKFKVRGRKYHLGETAVAYTLLTPTIITLILLFVLPLIILLVLSVNDFRLNKGVLDYNGIENFLYLFRAEKFWKAMRNTVTFAAIKLSLDVCLALCVALLLDSNIWCRKIMRTIYFSPVVVPVVACSLIWLWFYDPDLGPLNQILG